MLCRRSKGGGWGSLCLGPHVLQLVSLPSAGGGEGGEGGGLSGVCGGGQQNECRLPLNWLPPLMWVRDLSRSHSEGLFICNCVALKYYPPPPTPLPTKPLLTPHPPEDALLIPTASPRLRFIANR